jgi:ABC-type antimicrobial peptide transport system permease subunit
MPSLPIPVLRPMTEALDVYLLPQRVATWVSASMGLFGIILAAVGVYGVSAYAVSRRGREIAIRMALGASARSVAALVVRQGVRAPIVGIVAGLAVGAALATVVARLGVIPGVRPADPVVLLAAPLALVTVTVAAMAGPIRRALRRPTMTVLREE